MLKTKCLTHIMAKFIINYRNFRNLLFCDMADTCIIKSKMLQFTHLFEYNNKTYVMNFRPRVVIQYIPIVNYFIFIRLI